MIKNILTRTRQSTIFVLLAPCDSMTVRFVFSKLNCCVFFQYEKMEIEKNYILSLENSPVPTV